MIDSPKISVYIYIIFGLPLFFTSLALGAILFRALLRFCQKKKVNKRSQLDNPEYEVVKLKTEPVVMNNNDAYGVHLQ